MSIHVYMYILDIPIEVFSHILSWIPIKDICKNILNSCHTFRIYFVYFSNLKITDELRIINLMGKSKCYHDPMMKKCIYCMKRLCTGDDHQLTCSHVIKIIKVIGDMGETWEKRKVYCNHRPICKSCVKICEHCDKTFCHECCKICYICNKYHCNFIQCFICKRYSCTNLDSCSRKCLICKKIRCINCINKYVCDGKYIMICKRCIK